VNEHGRRDAGCTAGAEVLAEELVAPRYRIRRAFEVFFAEDGDVYLLRGGAGTEHVIRRPGAADRALLERLGADGVLVPPGTDTAERLAPLIAAGIVSAEPDLSALATGDAERFDRQLPYLADFGDPVERQRALRASSVAVLGVGGLGTWALGGLASAGVGRFVLIDDDTVQRSNLNRQILYTDRDLGAPKVERARDWLTAFDPSVDVEIDRRRVCGPEDLAAIATCDLLVMTADWPPYEIARWANAAAIAHRVPFITAGQQPPLVKIGPTYLPGSGACFACHESALRARFERYDELAAYRRNHAPPTTTLGPASALIGSVLALEGLHLLLGLRPLATQDRSLLVDLRSLRTEWESVERDPGCGACADLSDGT
jgi:bacteriocin biosynthesis cyclodehydratase domain-containing protein